MPLKSTSNENSTINYKILQDETMKNEVQFRTNENKRNNFIYYKMKKEIILFLNTKDHTNQIEKKRKFSFKIILLCAYSKGVKWMNIKNMKNSVLFLKICHL